MNYRKDIPRTPKNSTGSFSGNPDPRTPKNSTGSFSGNPGPGALIDPVIPFSHNIAL